MKISEPEDKSEALPLTTKTEKDLNRSTRGKFIQSSHHISPRIAWCCTKQAHQTYSFTNGEKKKKKERTRENPRWISTSSAKENISQEAHTGLTSQGSLGETENTGEVEKDRVYSNQPSYFSESHFCLQCHPHRDSSCSSDHLQT